MARIAKNLEELNQIVNQAVEISDSKVKIKDENKLRESVIDDLIYTAVFSENEDVKEEAKYLIREIANEFGAIASSIHDLYMAMGRGETKDFTTPAVNIRGMTYDVARRMFKVAIRNNIGAFIFEIAKSEIEYTFQRPSEYASCVLAAAIKEGYKGPVFIQGDHFQFSAKKYFENPDKGMIVMILFGIGTVPAMLFASKLFKILSSQKRKKLTLLSGIIVIILGILTILRGFGLHHH